MVWKPLIFLVIVGVLLSILMFILATEGRYFGKRFLRWLYNLRAGTFESRDDWEQWHHLIHRLEICPKEQLLDLGTQTGHLPRLVARQPSFQGCAIGMDWSEEMIRVAQIQSRLEGTSKSTRFLCADVLQPLPFPDKTFTIVVCVTGLLDGLRNPASLLNEIRRVLRPGGRFAFSYQYRPIKAPDFDPKQIPTLLEERGFTAPRSIPWLTTRQVQLSYLEETTT